MQVLASLTRPEYVFRPAQILRRLRCELRRPRPGYQTVKLPWGLPLRIRPAEEMGAVIRRAGVFELAVCESISRLIDPGDLVIDAGANYGQMTSLMALRAGAAGKVVAFEPHPDVFAELEYNLSAWREFAHLAPVQPVRAALSDCDGTANLFVPPGFRLNHGVAFLEGSAPKEGRERHRVEVKRIDSIFAPGQAIGLLKVDVEGHQLQVVRGAERLLDSGSIRDIVFEETVDARALKARAPDASLYGREVVDFLKAKGYAVFVVAEAFFGPAICPSEMPAAHARRISPNYIATRDPERLLARMSRRGWTALKRS